MRLGWLHLLSTEALSFCGSWPRPGEGSEQGLSRQPRRFHQHKEGQAQGAGGLREN